MQLDDYLNLPYTTLIRKDEDGDYVASIEELEGCVAHGASKQQAIERLEDMQRAWLEDALESGQPIPRPAAEEPLPSGKFLQRVPRSLHRNLVRLAKVEGVSLNQLVTTILAEKVGMAGDHKLGNVATHDSDIWAGIEAFEPVTTINHQPRVDVRALRRLQRSWNAPEHYYPQLSHKRHGKAQTR